jgi:hypothetical protein
MVRSRDGAILRPAHGLHRLRDHRRGCAAELARATGTPELDGEPMPDRVSFQQIAVARIDIQKVDASTR